MADISQFTHTFRATRESFPQQSKHRVVKRNRQPVSCQPCRARKLKCDRKHPCEACVKRDEEDSCVYGRSNTPTQPQAHDGKRGDREKAHERLQHIEELVKQMANSQSTPKSDALPSSLPSPTSPPSDTQPTQSGRLLNASSESRYLGSTHWSALLDNLQELKAELRSESPRSMDIEEESEPEDEQFSITYDSIFNCHRLPSIQSVLSHYLPPRRQLDRRLSGYFTARYLIMPVIHAGAFQNMYEKFCEDAESVSPLFISAMFSLCSLSARLSEETGLEPPPPPGQISPANTFLSAAGQCLVIAGYTKPRQYLVEALAMYSQAKYLQTLDANNELGLILSLLIRIAFQMGYHRDPDTFSTFTPFESEMRRRVWAMCLQFDLMISFQLGLPKNIPDDSWDTRTPANLIDSDFDRDTTVLPPARSEDEPTRVLYFIVKTRLTTGFGRVCSHALSFRSTSYDEVKALDTRVRQTHATIPPVLKIRKMSESLADPAYMVMHRINCEFMHQKSLCVLHRKYMAQGRAESTRACVEAASTILTHFIDLYMELQRGGRMHGDGWMLTSFTLHDFLLAAMILCLSLLMWIKEKSNEASTNKPISAPFSDAEIVEQLRQVKTAHQICVHRSPDSNESRRVASALKGVLAKFSESSSSSWLPKSVAAVSMDEAPELDFHTLTLQDHNMKDKSPYRKEHLFWPRSDPLAKPDLSVNPAAPNDFNPDLLTPGKFDIDISDFEMGMSEVTTTPNVRETISNTNNNPDQGNTQAPNMSSSVSQSSAYPPATVRSMTSQGLVPAIGLQDNIDFSDVVFESTLNNTSNNKITSTNIPNDTYPPQYNDMNFNNNNTTTDPSATDISTLPIQPTTTNPSTNTILYNPSFDLPLHAGSIMLQNYDFANNPFDSFLSGAAENVDWNYIDKYLGAVNSDERTWEGEHFKGFV